MALTPNDKFTIASLVYREWAKAYDEKKAAKSATWESMGKFCPKSEWPLYYNNNLERATQKERDANDLLDRVKQEYRDSLPA